MTFKTTLIDLVDRRNVKHRGSHRIERRGPDTFVRVENATCQHELPTTRADWDLPDVDVHVDSGMMSCPTCIQAVLRHPDPQGAIKQLRAKNQAVAQSLSSKQRERLVAAHQRGLANPDAPIWEILPDNPYAQVMRQVDAEIEDSWTADWDAQTGR